MNKRFLHITLLLLVFFISTWRLLSFAAETDGGMSSSSYSSFPKENGDPRSLSLLLKNGRDYQRSSTGPHQHDSSDHDHYGPSPTSHEIPSSISPWIKRFCLGGTDARVGDYYCEIPLSFIKDPVTTATICDSIESSSSSSYIEAAIKLLNGDVSHSSELFTDVHEARAADACARDLFDLLHSRFVVTYEGLSEVRKKYEQGIYGQCPRVFCRGYPLLPVGLHDRPKRSTLKLFCPKCRDIYHPHSVRHRSIDGAAFGTSLPHLMLHRMPELTPRRPQEAYVPRIFGFEIHESATELQLYNDDAISRDFPQE